MNRFFHGRLAIVLSFACVAGLGLDDMRAAAQAPGSIDQPTYSADAPPSQPADGRRYNCEPRRDAVETIANCQGVDEGHGNGGGLWKIVVFFVIAAVIAAIASKTIFSSNDEALTDQKLLEEGPQLPVSYPDGTLAVQGFTRDGW